MSQKIASDKRKVKVVTKYETVSDKKFLEIVKSVNRRYGKALSKLAKF